MPSSPTMFMSVVELADVDAHRLRHRLQRQLVLVAIAPRFGLGRRGAAADAPRRRRVARLARPSAARRIAAGRAQRRPVRATASCDVAQRRLRAEEHVELDLADRWPPPPTADR